MWSLNKIHQVGELAAAVAVVLSLVFVGLQVRESTIATQAATYQTTVAYDIELLLTRGTSSDGSRLHWAFLENPKSLTGDEYLRGRDIAAATSRHLENLYLQREAGMLSDEAWSAREPLIQRFVLSSGFSEMIGDPAFRQNYGGSFVAYAEQIRGESESHTIDE